MHLDYIIQDGATGFTADSGRCPDSSTLWRTLAGEAEERERARVVDHVFQCPTCRAKWQLAREMGAERHRPFWATLLELSKSDMASVRTALRRVKRNLLDAWLEWTDSRNAGVRIWAPVAIGLLAVAALTVWIKPGAVGLLAGAADPTIRDASADSAPHVESAIPEDSVLSKQECVLRWTGPADVAFDVEVRTEGLDLVDQVSGVEGFEYRVPAEKLEGLAGETTLLWRVIPRPRPQELESRTFVVRVR